VQLYYLVLAVCGRNVWDKTLIVYLCWCRSQWPRGPRRGYAAVFLLGLRVLIPPAAWIPVSFECCVLTSRGLCDRPITRPEEFYRLWWVAVSVHVSSDIFAHHQEHLNCIYSIWYYIRMLLPVSIMGELERSSNSPRKYSLDAPDDERNCRSKHPFQLTHDTNRKQHTCVTP